MNIVQKLPFTQAYKKLYNLQKLVVDQEIHKIYANPDIGTPIKQDLEGIYIHKFKINSQLYLLAYSFNPITPKLSLLGVQKILKLR